MPYLVALQELEGNISTLVAVGMLHRFCAQQFNGKGVFSMELLHQRISDRRVPFARVQVHLKYFGKCSGSTTIPGGFKAGEMVGEIRVFPGDWELFIGDFLKELGCWKSAKSNGKQK